VQYSHDAAANEVVGHPLVLVPGSLPGRLMSTPVFDNGEVAAIAGGVGGDDDNNDDDDDDNEDGNDEEEKKPLGGGVKLVPRGELRRDHRGMASVTTIIGGDRKRQATGDSV
jgi:hypothetical protein